MGACFALLTVASCSSPKALGTITAKHAVSAEQAFAIPDPGGPAVSAVTEQSFANGIEQNIYLATDTAEPGENLMRVQFFGPGDWKTAGQTSLRPGFLPPTAISAEMRQALPGVPMRRSSSFVQNRYGPFGYAMGRAREGDLCIYAWQALNSNAKRKRILSDKGAIQIRLRFCHKGAGEPALLAMMYNYSINAFFYDQTWNPFGDPSPTPVKPNEIVYPVGERGLEAVLPDAPEDVAEASRPRRRQASAAPAPRQPPAALPAPVGPVVPPPDFASLEPPALGGKPPAPAAIPAPPASVLSVPAVPARQAGATTIVPPPPADAGAPCAAGEEKTSSGCTAD